MKNLKLLVPAVCLLLAGCGIKKSDIRQQLLQTAASIDAATADPTSCDKAREAATAASIGLKVLADKLQ